MESSARQRHPLSISVKESRPLVLKHARSVRCRDRHRWLPSLEPWWLLKSPCLPPPLLLLLLLLPCLWRGCPWPVCRPCCRSLFPLLCLLLSALPAEAVSSPPPRPPHRQYRQQLPQHPLSVLQRRRPALYQRQSGVGPLCDKAKSPTTFGSWVLVRRSHPAGDCSAAWHELLVKGLRRDSFLFLRRGCDSQTSYEQDNSAACYHSHIDLID